MAMQKSEESPLSSTTWAVQPCKFMETALLAPQIATDGVIRVIQIPNDQENRCKYNISEIFSHNIKRER